MEAFGLQNRIGGRPGDPDRTGHRGVFNGKKRTVGQVFLPGYVLVEMDLDDKSLARDEGDCPG